MTKNDLKNIIKGLIIESINESKSKNFVSPKKTKKLKEQDEMQPVDPQASAEPDAGEMEGPDSEVSTAPMSALDEIDTIVSMLYSLRAKLSGDPEPGEEPEGEEVSDENEMGEEDLEDGSEESEQV
jgi:hypothetical protein